MLRNLEVGDKVTVQPFVGEPYTGKITKIGTAIIYVELMKIGSKPVVIPRTMRFSKNTFMGLGKDHWYDIADVMFGEHEKYSE